MIFVHCVKLCHCDWFIKRVECEIARQGEVVWEFQVERELCNKKEKSKFPNRGGEEIRGAR